MRKGQGFYGEYAVCRLIKGASMVKISNRANFQIKTTALTATAAKPAQAAAAPGEHDPSALPWTVVAWVEHWAQVFLIF